ncbi:MAG: dicarboxylate/amino acid:cation symporter [Chitinophagales bacterium]
MKNLALHWKIIIGMTLGILWAIFPDIIIEIKAYLNNVETKEILKGSLGDFKNQYIHFTSNWISPFGKIFVNLLKLIALPLVLFSVIGGIAGIGNPEEIGKMGFKTLGMYLATTIFAVSLGLGLVNLLQPGKALSDASRLENRINYELWAKTENIALKDNICYSCKVENIDLVKQVQEEMKLSEIENEVSTRLNTANKTLKSGPLQALVDMVPKNVFAALSSGAMLPVIFFAIFFGISLLYIPKKQSELVVNFTNAVNEVFLKMIDFIMKVSPFFVFALLAGMKLNKGMFLGLVSYSLVVILGLATMIFVIYPVLLKLISKKYAYFEFFKKIAPAQLMAFSTSSSAATLPITIECVEENLKINPKISGFVLPIGATVNMDGTSLYQAVAAIFLAQMFMVDLSLGQQITIMLTAVLASIGSAAVPSAGLVMLMIVLTSVGLNPAWIAIILPVDRILDMMRTTVNVTGDATICAVIDKLEEE